MAVPSPHDIYALMIRYLICCQKEAGVDAVSKLEKKIFTGPTYKLLLNLTVLLDVCMFLFQENLKAPGGGGGGGSTE